MTTTSTTPVQDTQHLITQIQIGHILSVFEELYDDEVVMIESDTGNSPYAKAITRAFCG